MTEANREIVLVTFHYSIVVKGIEKKLSDRKFLIKEVVSEPIDVKIHAGKTGMFILYLPEDITENMAEASILVDMVNVINAAKQKTIVIGESKYHLDVIQNLPALADFTWFDRPVDMDALCKAVENEIAGKVAHTKKRRILVVDDDPDYARMVREWLSDKYTVNVVTAGMQAITFLLKNPVDMILLDYEMPVVDGPQVFQMLRSEEATKDIPVVFLTGVGTREGVTRVMSLKPNGYLLKSTTKADLRKKVAEILKE